MLPNWDLLPDDVQLALSREAMYRAAAVIAAQAEAFADAIENGGLADRGGAEALRLFAAVVRAGDGDTLAPRGMAEPVSPWRDWDAAGVGVTPGPTGRSAPRR